jgi:hypothetical protein
MKFCFALTNLNISDTVRIEHLDVTTDYTVEEFIVMTNAYPALIEAVAKMAADAPKSVAPCCCDVSNPLNFTERTQPCQSSS